MRRTLQALAVVSLALTAASAHAGTALGCGGQAGCTAAAHAPDAYL